MDKLIEFMDFKFRYDFSFILNIYLTSSQFSVFLFPFSIKTVPSNCIRYKERKGCEMYNIECSVAYGLFVDSNIEVSTTENQPIIIHDIV